MAEDCGTGVLCAATYFLRKVILRRFLGATVCTVPSNPAAGLLRCCPPDPSPARHIHVGPSCCLLRKRSAGSSVVCCLQPLLRFFFLDSGRCHVPLQLCPRASLTKAGPGSRDFRVPVGPLFSFSAPSGGQPRRAEQSLHTTALAFLLLLSSPRALFFHFYWLCPTRHS